MPLRRPSHLWLDLQCRERWFNHLAPSVKKGEWTEEEDRLIMAAVKKHGTKWSVIVKDLPGRSDNAIKNRYYSAVRKAFRQERRDQTVEAAEASPGKAEGGRSYDDSAHVEAARVGIEQRSLLTAKRLFARRAWHRSELPDCIVVLMLNVGRPRA